MKEVSIKVNNQQVLTSMEVAEMIGKEHRSLMRDIRRYIGHIARIGEQKALNREMFIKSAYIDANNQSRPCYLITGKGCGFISNMMTGVKGAKFTAEYVERFMNMEDVFEKEIEDSYNSARECDVFEVSVKKQQNELSIMTHRLAELKGLKVNTILHLLYQAIESKYGISLNAYRSVYQTETGDKAADKLDVISFYGWIYDAAIDMCKTSIKKCEVF